MPFMRGGMYDVKKIIGPVAVATFTAMLEGIDWEQYYGEDFF